MQDRDLRDFLFHLSVAVQPGKLSAVLREAAVIRALMHLEGCSRDEAKERLGQLRQRGWCGGDGMGQHLVFLWDEATTLANVSRKANA